VSYVRTRITSSVRVKERKTTGKFLASMDRVEKLWLVLQV